MARLTSEQISKVSAWVAEGATLSQIQERLSSQFEISMTYMDVRFLVDDLNLALVEKEEPKKPEEPAAEAAPAEAADHQGRPGMAARTPGYRPTPQDITDFQVKLDAALRQAGY
jgi:hypothetical protein